MRTTTFLVTAALLSLAAGTAFAGHVWVDINPCEGGIQMPGCRNGEPIGDCWRYGREGPTFDPLLCPDPYASGGCLALGLLARDSAGIVTVQNSRSAASAYWNGQGSADANQQRVDTAIVAEGTLLTECRARPCDASSTATAARVSLFGGFIEAEALEASAAASCWNGPSTGLKVTSLVIGGVEHGDVVHPSTIVVPGLGVVTLGAEELYPTPGGGYGVSTTALRVDVIDALGVYRGTVRVSHAAASVN